MDWGAAVSGMLKGVGGSSEKNAQALQGGAGAPAPASPVSAFSDAMRQAQLERERAGAMQVQTTPTALAATTGGAMSQTSASPHQFGVPAGQTPTAEVGRLQVPSGGMVTGPQANQAEVLAQMYRQGQY